MPFQISPIFSGARKSTTPRTVPGNQVQRVKGHNRVDVSHIKRSNPGVKAVIIGKRKSTDQTFKEAASQLKALFERKMGATTLEEIVAILRRFPQGVSAFAIVPEHAGKGSAKTIEKIKRAFKPAKPRA